MHPLSVLWLVVLLCCCINAAIIQKQTTSFPKPTIIRTVAGGNRLALQERFEGRFNTYSAIVDKQGIIYIGDTDYGIIKFNPQTGEKTAFVNEEGRFSKSSVFAVNMIVHEDEFYFTDNFGFISKLTKSGKVVKIAGSGFGYSGDGGPALDAKISLFITNLRFMSNGDLIFGNCDNNRIRKISKDGIIDTIIGTGKSDFNGDGLSALSTNINFPLGLLVTENDEIIFTENNGNRVRKLTTNGTVVTIAGNGKATHDGDGGLAVDASIREPSGLSFSAEGDIIITCRNSHCIRKIDKQGIITTIHGICGNSGCSGDGGDATLAKTNMPTSVSVDPINGGLIITSLNCKIRKLLSNGTIIGLVGSDSLYQSNNVLATDSFFPNGITNFQVFKDKSIRVLASTSIKEITNGFVKNIGGDYGMPNQVVEGSGPSSIGFPSTALFLNGAEYFYDIFSKRFWSIKNGTVQSASLQSSNTGWKTVPASSSILYSSVSSIVYDSSNGDIYIGAESDIIKRVGILKIENKTGLISIHAAKAGRGMTGNGGPISAASFNFLKKLLIAKNGDIFVFDSRIRRISNGTIDEYLNIFAPYGCIDSNGDLIVVTGFCVQKIEEGTKRTTIIAGTCAKSGFSGDGGDAKDALFSSPSSVAVSNDGTIFVNDRQNKRIRSIDPISGNVSTIVGNGIAGESQIGVLANMTSVFSVVGMAVSPITNELFFIDATDVPVVQKLTKDGTLVTVIGKDRLLGGAVDIIFNMKGEILIAENNRIRKFNIETGVMVGVAGSIGSGGLFSETYSEQPILIPKTDDTFFYVDLFISMVSEVNITSGIITLLAGTGLSTRTNRNNNELALDTFLKNPRYAFQMKSGGILITEELGNRLLMLHPNGTISFLYGTGNPGFEGDGGSATNSLFNGPNCAIEDKNGDIYIADSGNNRIRKVDIKSGNISTIVGTGDAGYGGDEGYPINAKLNRPNQIYVNEDGSIYISDNSRLRIVLTDCPKNSHVDPKNSSNCECDEHYYGELCSEFDCYGINKNYPNVCSGTGNCYAPDSCECAFNVQNCEIVKCFGIQSNESSACSSNGKCIGNNTCECNPGYFGNQCENFTCFGLNPFNRSVCSGEGLCKDLNTCQCNPFYYGDECENFDCFGVSNRNQSACSTRGKCNLPNNCTCDLGYYGNQCEKFDCFGIEKNGLTVCSSHGNCIDRDTCQCKSLNGSGGYFGKSCSTKFLSNETRFGNDFTIIVKISDLNIPSMAFNCSKFILEHSKLGTNPICIYDSTQELVTIHLKNDFSVRVLDNLSININIFTNSSEMFVTSQILSPLQQPEAIIETSIGEVVFGCTEMMLNGSKSISKFGDNLEFIWSIIASPSIPDISSFSSETFKLPYNAEFGNYTIQLIVKSSLLGISSQPVLKKLIKVPNIPQVKISGPEYIEAYLNRAPLYVKKLVNLPACSFNETNYEFEWKQIEGPSIDLTPLSNSNLMINSLNTFTSSYLLQVALKINGFKSTSNVRIVTIEPEFEIQLQQEPINETSVHIALETSPSDVLQYFEKSEFLWNCLSVDKLACPQNMVDKFTHYSTNREIQFTLQKENFKSVKLSLRVSNKTQEIEVNFPDKDSKPIINVLSISPQKTYFTTFDVLTIQTMVSVDNTFDGIDGLVNREWMLDGQKVKKEQILSDIQILNMIALDFSTLSPGSHNLTFIATNIATGLFSTYTYSFIIAESPTPCSCTVSPSQGFALDTIFTIHCCSTSNILEIGFQDYKTGLNVKLLEMTSTDYSIQLPYTGSDELVLYSKTISKLTGASQILQFKKTIPVPQMNSISEIKKKTNAWSAFYKTLAPEDPRKIVFSYIYTTNSKMISLLSKRTILNSNCNDYNSLLDICNCSDVFKKKDCSMNLQDWISITNEKFSWFQLLSRDEFEIPTEDYLNYQFSTLYHVLESYDEVNEDIYSSSLNLITTLIDRSSAIGFPFISNKLASTMIKVLDFVTKSRIVMDGKFSNALISTISNLSKKISLLLIDNYNSTNFNISILKLMFRKIYPSDISNLVLQYRNDTELVTLENLQSWTSIYKPISITLTKLSKLSTTQLNSTQTETTNKVTTLKTSNIEISLQAETSQSSQLVANYHFLASTNPHYSKTSYLKGNLNVTLTSSAEMECVSNDSTNCELVHIKNNHFICKCKVGLSRISLNEKLTETSETSIVNLDSQRKDDLNYLGFLAFLIVFPLLIVLVIGVIILVMRRKKTEKNPKQNMELRSV